MNDYCDLFIMALILDYIDSSNVKVDITTQRAIAPWTT